ncbi:MAG: class I SAM-dependent methyltransferase [Planctomycetota bacterium]
MSTTTHPSPPTAPQAGPPSGTVAAHGTTTLNGDALRTVALPGELRSAAPPEIATEAVSRCPVCGGDAFDPHAVGFDYELLTCRNVWRFVRCRTCTHLWLNPRPAIASLPVIYPPHYYAYDYEDRINPIAVRGKQMLDGLKLRSILRHLPRPPRSYLDVGCGSGRFLKAMERRGVPRPCNYGLELDENVVCRLRESGYQAICARVEACDEIPDNQIDLITMLHVIEHVDDPGSVIRKVAQWLAPDGVLAIETPNVESWDARLFRRGLWGGYHIPRHWNLFGPSTLSRLLADNGLQVFRTRYQTGHSFWMYSFHHWLRYKARPRRTLASMFDPFKGLPLLVLFTALDKARAGLGFKTSSMLLLARKQRGSERH